MGVGVGVGVVVVAVGQTLHVLGQFLSSSALAWGMAHCTLETTLHGIPIIPESAVSTHSAHKTRRVIMIEKEGVVGGARAINHQ